MLSWYRYEYWFLFFVLPFFMILMPGILPTIELNNRIFGGGPIREWALNETLMKILDIEHQLLFIEFWQSSGWIAEVTIYSLIALSVFALLLPFLYLLGEGWMTTINSFRTSRFLQERKIFKNSGSTR